MHRDRAWMAVSRSRVIREGASTRPCAATTISEQNELREPLRMLSQADNEIVSRVGPGTPMGNLFRHYWVPTMLSRELPSPDSDPVRVLLLGEKLIGFRDTSGKVGLIQNHCPHRGASLFFGRNEEHGLRCVYHGWKFDRAGRCVDMPNEPPESNFKHRIRHTAYPCEERGGVIWAYMGPEG